MVLSGRRYVAVVQEAQGFVQLSLQTGAEAALINVGTTVQNHLPGLTGISERQYKAWLQQGRDSLPPQDQEKVWQHLSRTTRSVAVSALLFRVRSRF